MKGLTRAVVFGLAIFLFATLAPLCHADESLQLKGDLIFSSNPTDLGLVQLIGAGTASHLGKWTCFGECFFEEGDAPGAIAGTGVIVFAAADDDVLVGFAHWLISADGSVSVTLHWILSASFSDGSTVFSTGRFLDPPFPGTIADGQGVAVTEGSVATLRIATR
jgi:hypothetical protein